MKGQKYISQIIELLKSTEPEKIILFGSYAYGHPTEGSDLDIMVVTNDDFIPSGFSEKSEIYLKTARAISKIRQEFPVDLIVHTKAMHRKFVEHDSLFARELILKGKILYEKNDPGLV